MDDVSDILTNVPDRHVLAFYAMLRVFGRDVVKKLYSRQVVWRYAKVLEKAGVPIEEFDLLRVTYAEKVGGKF